MKQKGQRKKLGEQIAEKKRYKVKRQQDQAACFAAVKKLKLGFPLWLSRSTERSPIKMLSSGKRHRGMRLVNIIKTTPNKIFIALHFCTFYSQRGEKK